jgi:ferredoxin
MLRVNPIACDAHGVCADLLPEMVTLDPWGYPVIAAGPVPADLEEHARRAVASCPTLALRLDKEKRPGRRPDQRNPNQRNTDQRSDPIPGFHPPPS